MSVVNEASSSTAGVAPAASAPAAGKGTPFRQRSAVYRYGFIALILVLWELTGPLVNPIFFSYPSKIIAAAYSLTLSGDLPYYAWQSMQVLFYGLGFATVLTLVLTPCALMLRENVGAWWARRRGTARDEQPAQRSESLPKAAE